MSVEKLSVEKINAITSNANPDRGWRSSEKRNFCDFTAVKSITDANLHCGEFNYADFHGIAFKNADFSRSEIRYCNFADCSFENCRFDSSVDGEFSNFHGAKFKNCLFDGSWIFANFEETVFTQCSLRGDMLFANMNGAFNECEALNIQHLDLAKLPPDLGGLRYDTDQFPNI